ncbi:hypothetical protein [Endozoicomonas acroporae]|uniref:hypothetical protein n=1 Tax=Endozoicomonas acroporae TaxID=1701104 RepID=UPI0013D71FB9|nr:hypothetical protein [Endozoicomonas acroporae]
MSTQTFNAVVKLGGAVDGSFKGIGGAISKQLGKTQKSIRSTKNAQTKLLKEIEKNRKAGNDVSALEREYESLGDELTRLTRKQEIWNKAQDVGKAGGKVFGQLKTGMAGLTVGASALGGAFAGLTMANKDFAAQASQAAAVGLDFRTYQAFGKVIASAGFEADTVIDLVEEMNNKMGESAGIEELAAVQESLGILGLAYEDLAQLSPEKQFMAITKAAQELGDAQQASAAVDILMGGEANKIIGHLRQQGTSVDKLVASYKGLSVVTKDGEAGAKSFNKGMDSIKFAVGSAFQEISGLIGGALAPALAEWPKKIADFFNNNRDQITLWADKAAAVFPVVIEGIAGFGKGLYQLGSAVNSVMQFFGGWENSAMVVGALLAGKFLASVIGVAASIGTLVTTMGGFGAVMTAVGVGIKAVGAAVMANPIGLIAGAIALGALAIYKNWEPIKGFFSGLWSGVTSVVGQAWELFKTVFSYSPLGLIMKAWQPALNWISSKFDFIGNAASKVKNFFGFGDDQESGIGSALNANRQSPQTTQAQQVINTTAPARSQSNTDARKVDNINIYAAPGQDPKAIGRQTSMEWGGNDALYDFAGA